ncbi:MAG: type restriction-modification system methyltransferase subunit-like protein [Verrucomicrobiaceae bacterium]|nr:type restriction-modification system methyltransferase subunit-like protein [Verrucomicrobiaceae bacterium]
MSAAKMTERRPAEAGGVCVQLTPEVRSVLERSTITASSVTLPPGRLHPKAYAAVNKALEAAGGKWNKRGQFHVFPIDAREALGMALQTGKVIDHACSKKKSLQAFYTPPELAAKVAAMAQVEGKAVLEPSAGSGALVKACLEAGAKYVTAVEINPEEVANLLAIPNCDVSLRDFLKVDPTNARVLWHRIVMNPPFTKNQDVKHVEHALKLLCPGGRLVAIMANNTSRPAFQQLLAGLDHSVEEVPAGAFRASGTQVKTIILTVNKPLATVESGVVA